MPPSNSHPSLSAQEVAQAVVDVTRYMTRSRARFSISGGAASLLLRMHHGLPLRITEDIDLVIQPTSNVSAESISAWLLQSFPKTFVPKMVYGVPVPTLAFRRSDGSIKYVEIEIFDVNAWPQRPQYNLDNPDNEVTLVSVLGVEVPIFSARWLLREKIITAFERQGSRKEESDLDDACNLLDAVEVNGVDLTYHKEAVRHLLANKPEIRQSLELKIVCPKVLGEPWTWNRSAGVYWRLENDQLRYLDGQLRRHGFKWDSRGQVWYLTDSAGRAWFYSAESGDLMLWT